MSIKVIRNTVWAMSINLFSRDYMKFISLIVLFLSFSALADETCISHPFNFRITRSYIEVTGPSDDLRISYDEVRTLSRRSSADFKELIKTLSNTVNTEDVLTTDEASEIERFSLTVADGHEELLSVMYAKAYNKFGMIVARFMTSAGNAYRCQ